MTTYDFVTSNKRKTVLLIAVFSAFTVAVAWLIDRAYGYGGGLVAIAAVYSVISAAVGYYAGDRVALSASGAHPVTATDNPHLVRMVENLCIAGGMPLPKVFVIDDPAINAFATGRDPANASIAVTTGAISKLANEELEGVLAHELSHVKNYDIRVMTVVIVLVGLVSVLADLSFRMAWFGRRRNDDREGGGVFAILGILVIILAPLIAQLVQLAVSRKREFLADASGALLTRYPQGLANALRKIQAESLPMRHASTATAHLFIASPFSGKAIARLFATHPPIEDRIVALTHMAAP